MTMPAAETPAPDMTATTPHAPAILTELTIEEIPEIIERFDEEIGSRHSQQRVKQIRAAIKANQLLSDLLNAENSIPFGLVECNEVIRKNGGRMPSSVLKSQPLVFGAVTFATHALSMLESADFVQRKRLKARIQGALSNPDAMRALRLELSTAAHFVRRGCELEWPEMSGAGNFDLLVYGPGLGADGLEVECKSISPDKGRAVHRREALDLLGQLKAELVGIMKTLAVGLAVVVTVPVRLPKRFAERRALVQEIRRQVSIGTSARLESGVDIRIEQFDATTFFAGGQNAVQADDRSKLEQATRTNNCEYLAFPTRGGGCVIFALQSARDDDPLLATFRELSEAARRQLSGMRAALLIAGLDGITEEKLDALVQHDQQNRASFVRRVNDFLAAAHRSHVTGVCFFGSSTLRRRYDYVSSGGAQYFARNRRSQFWTDGLENLFQGRL